MPISETYIIQFLVQSSLSRERALRWYERESDGFVASSNGLRVEFDSVPNRAGALMRLSLVFGMERVCITEPARVRLFVRQYASEEDSGLVRLMHELWAVCARQCAERRNRSPEAEQRLREWMFKRLTGLDDTDDRRPDSLSEEDGPSALESIARFNRTESV